MLWYWLTFAAVALVMVGRRRMHPVKGVIVLGIAAGIAGWVACYLP